MPVLQKLKSVFSKVGLREAETAIVNSEKVKENEDFQKYLEEHQSPKSVKKLAIHNTPVSSIPQYMGAFTNVVEINFSGNKIQFIPWSIVLLEKLEILDLSHNCIELIPPVMCHLPSLKSLDLSHNLLHKLPTDLLNLRNLNLLKVECNPNLKSPSNDICVQGKTAIFEALDVRSSRRNQWEKWKPYYQGEHLQMKTLVDLTIECILESKIDFLSATHVPPTVKNYLSVTEDQEKTNIPKLYKCSKCFRYYSQSHLFENHDCQYIGSAKKSGVTIR